MTKKRKYRVGILGCGRIAGFLQDDPKRNGIVSHVSAYQSFPELFELVSCCSRDYAKASLFADRFQIPYFTDSEEKFYQEESLDIVSLCAYSDSRYQMLKRAIDSGVRGVFCEKPVASSLDEVEKMIELATATKTAIAVNYTRRWGADYQQVKKWLKQKVIGKIQHASLYFSGDIFHTGTHAFDLCDYLFGKPISVRSICGKKGKPQHQTISQKEKVTFEDYDVEGLFTFPRDVTVHCFGLKKKFFHFELEIWGEKGRVRIGNGLLELFLAKESIHHESFFELEKQKVEIKPTRFCPLRQAVWELHQAVCYRKKIKSNLTTARQSLEMAFGLVASLEKKNKKISFPLTNKKKRVKAR